MWPAVIDDWMIIFAAYTAAETIPMLFIGPDNSKIALPIVGSQHPSNTWFFGPT